jgi:hypothetical protein
MEERMYKISITVTGSIDEIRSILDYIPTIGATTPVYTDAAKEIPTKIEPYDGSQIDTAGMTPVGIMPPPVVAVPVKRHRRTKTEIEAEKAAAAAPVPPPVVAAPVPPPVVDAPVPPPVVAAPVPPPVVAAPVPPPIDFFTLVRACMTYKTADGKGITQEQCNAAAATCGLPSFQFLGTRPDLVPKVAEILGIK